MTLFEGLTDSVGFSGFLYVALGVRATQARVASPAIEWGSVSAPEPRSRRWSLQLCSSQACEPTISSRAARPSAPRRGTAARAARPRARSLLARRAAWPPPRLPPRWRANSFTSHEINHSLLELPTRLAGPSQHPALSHKAVIVPFKSIIVRDPRERPADQALLAHRELRKHSFQVYLVTQCYAFGSIIWKLSYLFDHLITGILLTQQL